MVSHKCLQCITADNNARVSLTLSFNLDVFAVLDLCDEF